jgi:hypothetical protein
LTQIGVAILRQARTEGRQKKCVVQVVRSEVFRLPLVALCIDGLTFCCEARLPIAIAAVSSL